MEPKIAKKYNPHFFHLLEFFWHLHVLKILKCLKECIKTNFHHFKVALLFYVVSLCISPC